MRQNACEVETRPPRQVAELVYAASIASAVTAQASPSGTFVPDTIYTNVGRRHAGVSIYHESEILAYLARGLPATLPYEGDFVSPETRRYLEKHIMRKADVPAENVH